jgi:hypothetical protein
MTIPANEAGNDLRFPLPILEIKRGIGYNIIVICETSGNLLHNLLGYHPCRPEFLSREKFFNKDVRVTLMKEIIKDRDVPSLGADECYSIAESMIDEIHQLSLLERPTLSLERHKGSLKRTLMRHLKQAKKKAQVG